MEGCSGGAVLQDLHGTQPSARYGFAIGLVYHQSRPARRFPVEQIAVVEMGLPKKSWLLPVVVTEADAFLPLQEPAAAQLPFSLALEFVKLVNCPCWSVVEPSL